MPITGHLAVPVRAHAGGRSPARPPLPEFLNLRPKFEMFLTLKGLAAISVEGHVDAMRRQTSAFGTTHPPADDVDLFVFTLYRSTASHSHKANNVKALEYWLEFIGQPRRFGRQRKPRRLIKQPPTEMEINRLFLACRSMKERAVLALLTYGACRPKELCGLRRQDIHIGERHVFIADGKGRKDGLVEVPSGCIDIVVSYLVEHPRDPGDYLFLTYQGNRYTQGALRKMIHVLARRAGVGRRMYPYLLRHAYATNLVLRGAPLPYIQRQMRHAWPDTTWVYYESLTAAQFESHERLFPKYV